MVKTIQDRKIFTLTLGCNLPNWFVEKIKNNEIISNQDGTFTIIKDNEDNINIGLGHSVYLDNDKNIVLLT